MDAHAVQDKRRPGAYGCCELNWAPPNAPTRPDSAPATAPAGRLLTDPALLGPGTILVTAKRPGIALVTGDRPDTTLVTADARGSVLVARADVLVLPADEPAAADEPVPVRWDQPPPGVSDEPHGPPIAPARAATTKPVWGSPGRSQPMRRAANPFGATRVSDEAGATRVGEEAGTTRVREETGSTRVREEAGSTRVREEAGSTRVREETGTTRVSGEEGTTPVSEETGTTWVCEEAGRSGACDTGRANVGAATPTPRTPAEATPPSTIRQLLTRHSTSS
jgi:hypothetical protein